MMDRSSRCRVTRRGTRLPGIAAVIAALALLASCQGLRPARVSDLEGKTPLTSGAQERPVDVALLPSQMPDWGVEPDLWPWFFHTHIDESYRRVVDAPSLEAVDPHDSVEYVIRPEPWGYFFAFAGTEYVAWLEIRYRFFDARGREVAVVPVEVRASASKRIDAVEQALRHIAKQFDDAAPAGRTAVGEPALGGG